MNYEVSAGGTPMLETERLVLRPLSADETDSLHRTSNEPDVRLHLWDDEVVSEATIKELIARSDHKLSKEKIGVFGIRMRGSEDLLGFCGFVCLEGMGEPELWYELTRKVWSRGIATEAAQACARYAFEEVGVVRVIAGADTPNAASLRVIEKLGMKYLGNIDPREPEQPYLRCTRRTTLRLWRRAEMCERSQLEQVSSLP